MYSKQDMDFARYVTIQSFTEMHNMLKKIVQFENVVNLILIKMQSQLKS